MLDQRLRNEITALINREVVPAIGCTEPVAVALAVSKATELLGSLPEKIEAHLSANIIKNAMGVGIPGTGMIGLPIAIALGAITGRSSYGLEVLRDVTPESVARGRDYISDGRISIHLEEEALSKLYIDIRVEAAGASARAVISGGHTDFVRLERGDEILLDIPIKPDAADTSATPLLSMAMIYDYATQSPIDEISFILEAKRLNMSASLEALNGEYGHSLGATIRTVGMKYYGDTPLEHMVSLTSAACDARMGGAKVAVMSNSGSGNQGITATMPVVSFANDIGASEEQTIRALILSHLTSIYIKQSLGRLSALCGCVVASTGASGAIVYLMGGGYDCICASIKNMVANLTGMICDGAKPSCALKISSGVTTALMSAMMAVSGRCVTSSEGIISEDVDATIRNLTSIGREAMEETDRLVLRIMTSKEK